MLLGCKTHFGIAPECIYPRYKPRFLYFYVIKHTNLNKKELTFLLQKLIVEDKTMKENSVAEIVSDLNIILKNNEYK